MNDASLREILTALRDNLRSQRQVMLADDLVALSELIRTQQCILESINQDRTAGLLSKADGDEELVREITDLLQTNELLARQSLSFARRMLGALNGRQNQSGQVSPGMGLDKRV